MRHLKLFEDFEQTENISDTCPNCKCNCDDCKCEGGECVPNDETERQVGRRFGSPSPNFAERYPEDDESLEEKKKSKGNKEKWVPIWVKNKEKEDAKSEKDKKGDKKEDLKGLTAGQKKLPAGLRAAIARKSSKRSPKD